MTISFCASQAILTITDPSAVCAPSTIDLTALAITAVSSAGTLTYCTDAAATTPLPNPNAVATSGTYYVQLAGDGCPIVMPVEVVINPSRKPTFI